MAKYLITDTLLDNLADSISTKSGVSTPMTISEMTDAVDDIPTGGVDLTTFVSADGITFTCNKTWAECSDIVDSGDQSALLTDGYGFQTSLVASYLSLTTIYYTGYDGDGKPFMDIIYNSNGTITSTTPSHAAPTLTTKSITANGTYNASSDSADGYSSVTVNVSGGTVKMGALRSDAELVQSWTSDKLFVQDMLGTIPAYTTSNTSIVSTENLTPIVDVDFTTYDYILVYRCLNTPIYSNGTNMGTGKLIHSLEAGTCELVSLPEAEYVSGYITGVANAVVTQNNKKTVYAGSSSSVSIVTLSTVYGIYNNFINPAISGNLTANGTITAKSPSVTMRGSSTYFSSTYWGALTDIRLQYVIELWRSPKASPINCYAVGSQELHIIDCATGNGTLT